MRRRNIRFRLVPALAALLMACDGGTPDDVAPPASTYAGAPADFTGEGVLLVVTWADWASVWPLTRDAVLEYRAANPSATEVRFVNADDEAELARSLGAEVVPSVLVVREGQVVASAGNVTTADEVAQLVGQGSAR